MKNILLRQHLAAMFVIGFLSLPASFAQSDNEGTEVGAKKTAPSLERAQHLPALALPSTEQTKPQTVLQPEDDLPPPYQFSPPDNNEPKRKHGRKDRPGKLKGSVVIDAPTNDSIPSNADGIPVEMLKGKGRNDAIVYVDRSDLEMISISFPTSGNDSHARTVYVRFKNFEQWLARHPQAQQIDQIRWIGNQSFGLLTRYAYEHHLKQELPWPGPATEGAMVLNAEPVIDGEVVRYIRYSN